MWAGHANTAEQLRAYAHRRGVPFSITGYLTESAMLSRIRQVLVPVAAHRHLSASGSIGSWLAGGRRPLVADSSYAREIEQLRPGTVQRYQPNQLAAAIARALADPHVDMAGVWHRAGARPCRGGCRLPGLVDARGSLVSTPPFGARVPGNAWPQLDGVRPLRPRTVSVVVVHHDQERQLSRTLTALARQRYLRDRLEVIVVDDGSRRVPDVPEGVRLLRQERRGARRAAARNRGARASRGEILCFLDADTAPEPEYVGRLARLPSLTPEAVVVGRRRHARLDAVDSAADITAAGPAHELPAPAWLHDGYAATRDLRDAGPRAFRYVISAVLGCTRWFFDELGGFDEEFVEYGGEDWEWAHRAWLSGALFAHACSTRSPGTTDRIGERARWPTGARRRTPRRCGWRS